MNIFPYRGHDIPPLKLMFPKYTVTDNKCQTSEYSTHTTKREFLLLNCECYITRYKENYKVPKKKIIVKYIFSNTHQSYNTSLQVYD